MDPTVPNPKGTHTYGFQSPEGTQAYSRQPGLAVPGTIDSESSEGAQADHASPTAPSPKTPPPTDGPQGTMGLWCQTNYCP